jgi:hypothetical protein
MALEGGEGLASHPGRSLPPGKTPVPIVQEAVWAPGLVWTGAENLAPTGIRSPDRPTRNQSLYRLSYPAHIPRKKGQLNPLNAELNPICYLLALLGTHHFLYVSRIRVKLLTLRLLMSYGAPILDVSRSHTTTQHSR